MRETDKEQISALLDGELPEHEAARCLDRLTRDPDLRSAWGRYHLIGDALRGEPLGLPGGGLAGRVSAALEREPALPFQIRISLFVSRQYGFQVVDVCGGKNLYINGRSQADRLA